MSDDLDPTTDPILQRLRRDRPVAGPSSEVRAQHRQEVHVAMADARRRRRPWLIAAAAAACIAVVGGVVLANGGASDVDRQVATGDKDATESSPTSADDFPGPALTSDECGGALPFDVPVLDGFDGPRPGPATGEPAATSSGQLVAHWSDGETDIEVRWPAEIDADLVATLSEDELAERGQNPVHLTDADLSLHVHRDPDGPDAGAPMPSRSFGTGYGEVVSPSARYEIAVAAEEWTPSAGDDVGGQPPLMWGEGLCGVVQLTFGSTASSDVLPTAKRFFDQLVAAGGPLFPDETPADDRDLVTARTEATELDPVTRCNGPVDNTTESTPVGVTNTHDTADQALAAHLETRTLVDEGPFGTPETTYTVPTAGYTAISLPDGRVAYEFPGIVAYFIAEEVDGGWAITRYEGPTC